MWSQLQDFDQEESEFSIFDSFDCHTDDEWLDFYEQSPTFHCFIKDQKDENERTNNSSNSIDYTDSISLNVVKNHNEITQNQEFHQDPMNQPTKKLKKPKTKVMLCSAAEQFRKRLYKLLSNGEKKIVRKEYVFLIHSLICEKHPNIRDVRRDEYRSIGNYFNSFCHQQNLILQAIRELKENGLSETRFKFSSLTSNFNI